jgi:anti-sigma regulatory factor (Ser/Thr protein kinase)
VPDIAAASRLRHVVLFYRGTTEYLAAIEGIVRAGIATGEPVMVAVPAPTAALTNWPASRSALVTAADMTELGRNPARIAPALRAFADAHRGQRIRIVTESVWPGRSAVELCEAARFEVLVERALAGVAGTLLCPYDALGLPPAVLADAACTHPWQADSGEVVRSASYGGPDALPVACRVPLPSPPHRAEAMEYLADLRPLRAMVTAAGQRAGLPARQVTDLTTAVSELAANTLRHTRAGGVAYAWQSDGEMLCQVADTGHIADPLAGLVREPVDQPGGKGLWLVNQLCDLVEVRTTPAGTVIRVHMRLPSVSGQRSGT